MKDKKVFKYTLQITDFQQVVMPKGAIPLDIQLQGDQIQLWCLVEVDDGLLDPKKLRPMNIMCVGTGHAPVPSGFHYIATVQVAGFVWHFFRQEER